MDAMLLISRSLSYSVILLSFCMKLPQISAIFSAKGSRGLNLRGYWMEIACYLIGSSYGYFHDFHLSTYGESILLGIQSATIIYLAVFYGNRWNVENALCFIVISAFTAGSISKVIPASLLYLLLLSTLPLSVASKLAQIVELYKLKSAGDVSTLMWGLATYGCAGLASSRLLLKWVCVLCMAISSSVARLFTVVVEIKDTLIFISFLVNLLLNVVVVSQCLHYGSSRAKH